MQRLINLKIKSLRFQYDKVLIDVDQNDRNLLTFIFDCIIIRIRNYMAGALLTHGINARRKSSLLQRVFYTEMSKIKSTKWYA